MSIKKKSLVEKRFKDIGVKKLEFDFTSEIIGKQRWMLS